MVELDGELSVIQVEKTKRYSIVDGSGYNVMVGFGEQYVIPFAIRLGASNSEVAILSSVPTFLGSLFQLLGAKLTEIFKSRRKLLVFFAIFQALILFPLFLLPLLTRSILVLTFFFSLFMVFSNIMVPTWTSMIGDIVKDDARSSYFARRNRITLSVLVLALIMAGLILNYFSGFNVWLGFGILFSIAVFGRIVSLVFLFKHFEPRKTPTGTARLSFVGFTHHMRRSDFGNFVIFRISIAFCTMIAVPFFSVYMLKNLGFSYIQYSAVILIPVLIKALSAPYWGRLSSRFGNRNVMYVTALLITSIPLLWFLSGYFFSDNNLIVFLGILWAEAVSGFAWGGFELVSFNYMLETSLPEIRARLIAYFNVMFGIAVLLGGLLSGFLVKVFTEISVPFGAILLVFLISALTRMLVVLFLMPSVKEVKHLEMIDERRLFFEAVIVRPFGFAMHSALATLTFIEQGITTFDRKTGEGFEKMSEPLIPLFKSRRKK
ncbi:MAG: MFS transporter [archaeon]